MELIDFTRYSLIVLHFVGLASLLGGFLTQMKAMAAGTAKVIPAMIHGAWTALATGVLLVGVAQYRIAMGAEVELDNLKIGVKSIVITIILILVMTHRKKDSVKAPLFGAVGALTLTNVILAVFW
jgi:hypothetical protein